MRPSDSSAWISAPSTLNVNDNAPSGTLSGYPIADTSLSIAVFTSFLRSTPRLLSFSPSQISSSPQRLNVSAYMLFTLPIIVVFRLLSTFEIMSYAWSRLFVSDWSSIIFCWLNVFFSSIFDSSAVTKSL